jgi:hypothetical protein
VEAGPVLGMPEVRPALLVNVSATESGKAKARNRTCFVVRMMNVNVIHGIDRRQSSSFLTDRLTLDDDVDEDDDDDDDDVDDDDPDDDKDDDEDADEDDDDESEDEDDEPETWQVFPVQRFR